MNGQECAKQNFQAFQAWAASKTDGDFREMVRQNQLNRGEICRECSFEFAVFSRSPHTSSERPWRRSWRQSGPTRRAFLRSTSYLTPIHAPLRTPA